MHIPAELHASAMLLRVLQLKLHGMLGVPRSDDGHCSSAGSETSSAGDCNSARSRRKHRKPHKLPLQYLNSVVQNTDENFFENFTAIHWKLQSMKEAFMKPEMDTICVEDVGKRRRSINLGEVSKLTAQEMDKLYVEVLYTILHKIGLEHGLPLNDELIEYSQQAFRIALADHHHLLAKASITSPPVLVLNVLVIEAKDLIAKDINGYSDPFCMMGIMPGHQASPQSITDALAISSSFLETPPSPQSNSSHSSPADEKNDVATPISARRRSTLIPQGTSADQRFFGSFRRKKKQVVRMEDVIPVKYIQATSVHKVTLNPKWNETFQFDIDDVQSDQFHLDIWDHDDEASVVDAVKKLNEVSNFQGFKRYFKQVAQSARSGSDDTTDDFLGSFNIKLSDIPSTGIEDWYDLEAAKSSKSQIRGKLKLKIWFGARDKKAGGDGVKKVGQELLQHADIIKMCVEYELRKFGQDPILWLGRIPRQARTILHQHALQGGLTEFQQAAAFWLAYNKIHMNTPISYRLLHDRLTDMLKLYTDQSMANDQNDELGKSFLDFTAHCLTIIAQHRTLLPPWQKTSEDRMQIMLKCLKTLHKSALYAKCVPYKTDLKSEIIENIKKSAEQFYESAKAVADSKHNKKKSSYVYFATVITMLNAGMHESKTNYQHSFVKADMDVNYLTITYEQFDYLLSTELSVSLCNDNDSVLMHVFELYFALSEFLHHATQINELLMERLKCAEIGRGFEWAMNEWLELAKGKIIARIDAACQIDKKIENCKGTTVQSTSYVDICYTLQQILEFFDHLHIGGGLESYAISEKVVQLVCKACEYYTDKVFAFLAHAGFYENITPLSQQIVCQLCMTVNDAEQMRRVVRDLTDKLAFEQLVHRIELEQGQAKSSQLHAQLNSTVDACDRSIAQMIESALKKLVERKKNDLKKLIFHLAWSPAGCPVETAVQPLVDKLDGFLFNFHKWLLHRNFVRLLLAQLTELVNEIRTTVDENMGREPVFYARLHEALDVLVEFFHAAGKGMTLQSVRETKGYEELIQLLSDNETNTDELILHYYTSLLKAQENATDCRHGILNVRAYYNAHANTLVVDVIGAKNIIPLDTNGLSDPFVIVELVPPTYFVSVCHKKSKICYKTLNPLWDETFEFTLSSEPTTDCMLHFIVLDYDFLLSNDFAGEAVLQITDVPGFVQPGQSNQHAPTTLRQFNLILIRDQQRDSRDEGPLKILDNRKEDKTATDFIKHVVAIKKS